MAVSTGGPRLVHSLVSGHVPHSSKDWEKCTNLNSIILGFSSVSSQQLVTPTFSIYKFVLFDCDPEP